MGEILLRTRLGEDMFAGLAWLGRMPGRFLHVNVLGCAIFTAVSGTSAATAAAIGRMSVPELTRRGYPEKLILGTLAGSATLGLLVPPSIIMSVYGVATEQSIARLFIAGILPGLMLVPLFGGYVMVQAWLHPNLIPAETEHMTLGEKFKASKRLIAVVALIGGVIGTIYTGVASPTDAAAVGLVLALLLTFASGNFGKSQLIDAFFSATKTSCVIAFGRADSVLNHPRLLSGRDFSCRADHLDHPADGRGGGDRPALVRHLSGAGGRNEPDHPAGWH